MKTKTKHIVFWSKIKDFNSIDVLNSSNVYSAWYNSVETFHYFPKQILTNSLNAIYSYWNIETKKLKIMFSFNFLTFLKSYFLQLCLNLIYSKLAKCRISQKSIFCNFFNLFISIGLLVMDTIIYQILCILKVFGVFAKCYSFPS
jgi:hypothetical protein